MVATRRLLIFRNEDLFMIKNTVRSIAFGLAVLAALGSQEARASVLNDTYTFTGVCRVGDCVGVGIGSLVVNNYVLGGTFTNANFVSFDYTSSIIPALSITSATLFSIGGSLNSDLANGVSSIGIIAIGGTMFVSSTNGAGAWCIGSGACALDDGPSSSWASSQSSTPEPATLFVSVLGLAAMGFARRKQSA